ncbi:hypothetical protein LCGC14_0922540 [marine sediment metagenome]|uniref:Uncharacterized protein n=1 Tax=marine sediment metagenome TaxID=412755 RepID=A0A0F9NV44_9ZZZZ
MIIREYKCGCKITSTKNYPSIEYCPKHKAAPDIYEALKEAENYFVSMKAHIPSHGNTLGMVQKALAKAEEKEEDEILMPYSSSIERKE